jgi:hypothetical protein
MRYFLLLATTVLRAAMAELRPRLVAVARTPFQGGNWHRRPTTGANSRIR